MRTIVGIGPLFTRTTDGLDLVIDVNVAASIRGRMARKARRADNCIRERLGRRRWPRYYSAVLRPLRTPSTYIVPLDMHFATLSALLSLPLLAVATPWATPTTVVPTTTVTITETATVTAVSECNTGSIQCCDSLSSSSNPVTGLLLGLLGVVVEGINVPIGITCTPITVLGIGSGSTWLVSVLAECFDQG